MLPYNRCLLLQTNPHSPSVVRYEIKIKEMSQRIDQRNQFETEMNTNDAERYPTFEAYLHVASIAIFWIS